MVDTPGILAGSKQTEGREYKYAEAVEWFASRADRILLMFDAHKLDIGDEFNQVLVLLRAHSDKLRVVSVWARVTLSGLLLAALLCEAD